LEVVMLVDVVNGGDELVCQLRSIISGFYNISSTYIPDPQHLGAVSIGQP